MAKSKVSIKEKVEKARKDTAEASDPGTAAKNVTKLEGDMDFAVQNLKDKIQEARSRSELEATQDIFEGIFGVGAPIPEDIQSLYNAKLAQLDEEQGPLVETTPPPGWVKMTREEAKLHEENGVLAGYDGVLGHGLINK